MLGSVFSKLIKASTKGFRPEEIHLTRFLQYKSLLEMSLPAMVRHERVASISGSERLCKHLGFPKSTIVPLDHPQYDARSLPFEDSYFDVCIADQVLEHIDSEPSTVFKEISRVLAPGGIFINATVMTYPIHYGPSDMWRFTPEGHNYLFTSADFEIINYGTWGGRTAVQLVAMGLGSIPVPAWKSHPIHKIAEQAGLEWPVVIWAVGRNRKKRKVQ